MQELIYPHMFLAAVEQHGKQEAVVDGNFRATWGEHADRVSRVCHALAGPLGVKPQDRFAVLALNGHARDAIAGYKIPKSVEFRDEPLPLSGAMKVLKKDLRAPYWEGKDKKLG